MNPKGNKIIGIIMGGYSNENKISLKSGQIVYETLKSDFQCYKIHVNKEKWILIDENGDDHLVEKSSFNVKGMPFLKFDCIFNAIHGSPGEDGVMQNYFNKLKIPLTGCRRHESELTFDKIRCLNFLSDKGINIAKSIDINKSTKINIEEIERKVGFPCFVKASKSGSSFGVYKVHNKNELIRCVNSASMVDENILIESYIEGREFSVGVITYKNKVEVLPITEIISSNDFFDYEAKYEGKSDEITPADISCKLKLQLERLSEKIYMLLNLRGFSRSEFIVNDSGIYFLETNTVPGLTEESILPQQAKCANISLKDLFTNAINEVII